MEHYSLLSLMIVVTIAFLVPILLVKLKLRALPVVVAEIVAGMIVGKSGLDLIGTDPILELLSLLGFIYLMFLSGVEIDFSFFRTKKKSGGSSFNPFGIAISIFIVILVLSFFLSKLLVMMGMIDEPFFMTIIIATISLGVVMPVLKEKRLLDTALGQTLLLITVISDFVTMIMLAVYISWLSGSISKMLLLLLFFVLVVVIYALVRRFAGRSVFQILSKGTTQIGTRAVFALILVFVVLSESLGAENILGAFLAGVIVSLIVPNRTFIHPLDTFGYGFLIPIFFVMVGVKMEIWGLFTDWRIILLIPVMLLFILISKLVPILILKRWFSWSETIGSGILLASTLSLVIAASTIAFEIGLIDASTHGAFILVAVLSCLIFPVFFNRIFPNVRIEKKTRISIVGANHVTIPVTQSLNNQTYEVKLFSTDHSSVSAIDRNSAIEVSSLTVEVLASQKAFEADVIVLGTTDDEVNVLLSRYAQSQGIERIIVRVEDPVLQESVQESDFHIFSTLFASTTLLQAAIENPSALLLMTQKDESIKEIVIENPEFSKISLKDLPLLGNLLVLRIYRGQDFIIPHGSTELQIGDRLLVSGDSEAVFALKQKVE
jgi:monovalent cation:H+ antiporter-2, CPA2 family